MQTPWWMSPRVLVVDDHRDLAETLAEALADEGIDAVVTGDPAPMLREEKTLHFDAAVIDVHMPGVDGIELLRQLVHRVPGAVYVLSTPFADDARLAAPELRAHPILTKPFGPDVLIAALRDAGVIGAAAT